MIDKHLLTNEIFENLANYIASNTKYIDIVKRDFKDNLETYPRIVFIENKNTLYAKTFGLRETTRLLDFEIDIYALDNDQTSAIQISDELEQMIDELMIEYYGMVQVGKTAFVPRINVDFATKTILHYSCTWLVERHIIN